MSPEAEGRGAIDLVHSVNSDENDEVGFVTKSLDANEMVEEPLRGIVPLPDVPVLRVHDHAQESEAEPSEHRRGGSLLRYGLRDHADAGRRCSGQCGKEPRHAGGVTAAFPSGKGAVGDLHSAGLRRARERAGPDHGPLGQAEVPDPRGDESHLIVHLRHRPTDLAPLVRQLGHGFVVDPEASDRNQPER